MMTGSAFHVDCSGVIPECEFKCAKCVQEIQSVLGEMEGVEECYAEGEGIVVQHDPSKVSVEDLIEMLGRLPSFYKGFFAAKLFEG
ncbi:MAG: cation transporter [Planctomycetota bacterium]|jgi:copper chaperone CopZ